MNVRGWILYLGFNELEDHFVTRIRESCWYRDWLQDGQPECYGRVFDFSDHVVLYFGQLLPIALIEILHAVEFPYWTERKAVPYNLVHTFTQWQPLSLVAGVGYLYFLTYLGAYKTASFFHTGTEIFAGFAVSLLIHVPLCCLQCSERCARARRLFFGPTATASSAWESKSLS
jgi:hypothetical protein